MIHIGICGTEQSIQRIHSIKSELNEHIQFTEFVYKNIEEVHDLVKAHVHKVNGWLFSTPLSFKVANDRLNFQENHILSTYVPINLYKSLAEIGFDQVELKKNFSLDFVNSEDEVHLKQVIKDIHIEKKIFNTFKIESDFQLEEIENFHLSLYESSEIDAAITSIESVYSTLKKLNVPVYHLNGSTIDIKESLNLLIEKIQSHSFKNNQIAVVTITLDELDKVFTNSVPSFKWQKIDLNIKRILLDFCEKSSSSLIENGLGKYQIFSVRRHIEENLCALKATISQINLDLKTTTSIGIGYGENAAQAEVNASKAIQQQKKNDFIIIENNHVITESTNNIETSYSTNTTIELTSILKSISVNVTTYNKMKALSLRMKWLDFTANDISEHLSMTLRNAQRVVSKLVEVGLLEQYSERIPTARGRGRKTYRFK